MHHQESSLKRFPMTCESTISIKPVTEIEFDSSNPDKYHEAYDCLLEQEILFRILHMFSPRMILSKQSLHQMLVFTQIIGAAMTWLAVQLPNVRPMRVIMLYLRYEFQIYLRTTF
jgi:hypothetical protein